MGKRAVFFCSASFDIDPAYNKAARECVRAACDAGYGIVSGGSFRGTMGVVCDAAIEFHAPEVIGVLPRFMAGLEHKGCTELHWTETMSQRKEKMREGVSLVVALPGGIGTLDEFAETYCLVKLKRMEAKLVVLNINGFYEPLKALLNHYVEQGMLPKDSYDDVHYPTSVEEFEKLISE